MLKTIVKLQKNSSKNLKIDKQPLSFIRVQNFSNGSVND
jgi:hypothetical protein